MNENSAPGATATPMWDELGHEARARPTRARPLATGRAMRELEAAVARVMRSRQGPQAATRYLRSCGWSVDEALNALARRESGASPERS